MTTDSKVDLTLRVASAEEGEALGDLGFAAWEASAFAENDAGRADRAKLRRSFRDFCSGKSETILVAVSADGPLGWGARENGDHTISDLWVAPFAQGQGVGAALLAALEAVIALDGFSEAELETLAANAGAVRFYLRNGYEPVWRGRKFSADLDYELDKIRFRKSLAAAA
jgi:Acetyltransferases